MTAGSPKGRNGHYPKYCRQKCRGKDALMETFKVNIDTIERNTKTTMDKLKKQLEKIQTNREILTEKLINGTISDTSAHKMFDKYDKDELDLKSELLELRTHNDNVEELLELGFYKLTNLKQTLEDIKEPEVRFRFQKWLFPVGLTYDGEKFGTAQMPLIFRLKKEHPCGYSDSKSRFGGSDWT